MALFYENNESLYEGTKLKKYDPPYSSDEVKEKYGEEMYKTLSKDPVHSYRMETGIELIHKEPTKEELERIWANWNLMSKKQKMESDKKSMELFGKTNKEHYKELILTYNNPGLSLDEFVSSEIIKDYSSKQDMRLSQFTKMTLNDSLIQVHKDEYKTLSHVRINKNTKGIVWLDGNRLVAIVNSEIKDDDYIWINAFEIFGDYKGHGLSKQILRVSIKELKITHLSVNKNNKVAYELYKKYGFKTYKETDKMYFMSINSIENESCMLEETIIDKDKLPKFIYHISDTNHDGETFKPRVYDNDNVKKGMERRVKRVCFSDSITRALYSIFPNGAYDADFYVHIPDSECKVYKTTMDDIYDSDITHELWIKEPVKMKCIGKIHINGVSDKTHTIEVDKNKAGYGKKKYNETKWKWIEKYEENNSLYESCIEESNNLDDKLLENIKKFNKELAIYEYIVVNNDGSIVTQIKQNSFKNYKTLSPERFNKFKGGICWDYVAYEYKYFKSKFPNVKIKTFYFAIVKKGVVDNTHTFLLFYLNDKVYWFEASWKSHIGITEYKNEDDALTDITNTLRSINKNDDWFIVEYNAGNKDLIGISDSEYINYMNRLPEYRFKETKDIVKTKIQNIKIGDNGKIINELYIEESNKKSNYIYEKLKDSKDVEDFYKTFQKVFNEKSDMSEKDVRKDMKSIKFNDMVIGYIGFSYYNQDNKKYLGFGNFIIKPEYQRLGYGINVINDIVEKNKDHYDEIYCYVDKTNVNAIKFYKKIANVDTKNLTKYGYYVCIYSKSGINESSDTYDSKREKVLNKTEEILKELGKSPKVSKSDREKWLNHKQQMFGDSLCMAALGNDGLKQLCTKVNKEIKPLGGHLSPDNYGTAFLSVKESTILTEEAEYDKKNKYPVYIVAMHSGTPLANIIQKVTNDEFSHACISFNSKLDPLYSFGAKELGKSDLGLVKQSPTSAFYKSYKAHYKVFVAFVDKESYAKMKNRIQWFETNENKMKYDFIGLIKILFNKDTEKNTYKYFCSRFVSEILGFGKQLAKLPSLYKPQDLVNLDFVSLVNGGEDFFKYSAQITEKNLKKVKNHIFNKVVFGESNGKNPDEIYTSFHLEPEYKDPKYCCWDEELYYRDLQSAVKALDSSNKEKGEYEVYTDLGCGKTKYIGQITYYNNPDTGEASYVWNKIINEVSYLIEDNAANTAMVGTAGNIFIHNCMKKNTFVETPEETEYIVSRDGGTDIFRFDKDGKKYKLTREEFTNDYTVLKSYRFTQPLINPVDYYRNVLESTSGYDFYLNLINNIGPAKDISKDIRFEVTESFFDELEIIKKKIFCEYYNIKNNKSVIDWVDKNIQSLIEVSYGPDSEKSVNELESSSYSDYFENMIERLKTLKTFLPSID